MKFCENCGAQLDDNDVFCQNCGTQQSNVEQDIDAGKDKNTTVNKINVKSNDIKQNKKIVALIGVAVIAIIIAIIVHSQLKKRVNINDYISIEYTGYNTVGTASYKIDKDGLKQAILKAQGKKNSEILSDSTQADSIYQTFMEGVDISLSKSTALVNGDNIQLNIEYNKALNSLLGIKIVCKNKEYKVDNLQEAKEINIFDDVSVTFTGTSPNGKVSIKNNSKDTYISKLTLAASKTSGIKIGEKITVSVDCNTDELLKKGYILKAVSKDYVCEKLDEYISKVEDLTDEQLDTLKKEGKDKIESYCAQKSITQSDLGCVGAYTLVSKNTSDNGFNKVYLIYQARITAKKNYSGTETETKIVYMPVCINGVVKKADNTIDYKSTLSIVGGTSVGSVSINGYLSEQEMYTSIITKQKDLYTYTLSGNVKEPEE